MKKLTEIRIRQALLGIAWIVYLVLVLEFDIVNSNSSWLSLMISFGIPWIGVMIAMVSLANRARKEKNKK